MFELNVDFLIENIKLERKYKTISKFPYSERDIAFVIPEDMVSGDIIDYIYKVGGKHLISVDVFDIFKGGRVGSGNVSFGVRMKFQSQERTLNDKEVDKHFHNIINKTQHKFSISLRK
jgi:phenylalanyl-tRNA synthetase beta chain